MLSQQHEGNLSAAERTWSALIGASLSILALRRGGSVFRALEATAGAALLARAFAGHCGVKAALTGKASLREGMQAQWRHMSTRAPASDRRGRDSAVQAPSSASVDAALEETFPASDPPASHLPDEPPINAAAKWQAAREFENSSGASNEGTPPRSEL